MKQNNFEFNSSDKLEMLSLENLPDQIIHKMNDYLPKNAVIFEYWTGLGRNAIPLAKNWYEVHVQDLNEKLLDSLKTTWDILKASSNNEYWKLIIENSWDALNHEPEHEYDGFICIRVLHLLSPENAWNIIYKMQKNTKIWWLNAINFFTSDTLHKPDFFFPSIQELKNVYKEWNTVFESSIVSEANERTNWRQMFQQSILFEKTK